MIAATRRMPVPFNRQTRRTGRGHLVPKLDAASGAGFLRLPGLKVVEFGVVAFVGSEITTLDVMNRWRESAPLPIERGDAERAVANYFEQLQAFSIGCVIEITYANDAFLLSMISRTPRFEEPMPNI